MRREGGIPAGRGSIEGGWREEGERGARERGGKRRSCRRVRGGSGYGGG